MIQYTNFLKNNTIFAALIGLSFIVASLLIFSSGYPVFMNPTLDRIILFLYVCGLFLQIKQYRDGQLDGVISYGTGVRIGSYIALVTSCVYGVYIYILYTLHPELLEYYLTATETAFRQVYQDASLVDNMISMLKAFTSAASLALTEAMSKMFSGVVYTLVIALILKRKLPVV